uniref:Uncharacterized protein n=1 Tax=Anopheles farauti TaxID=69004 RepID=A0A182QFB4_9DIPT
MPSPSAAVVALLLCGVCVLVAPPGVRSIEVHEDVNESPLEVRLRVNTTAAVQHSDAAASPPPPPPPPPALVNERNVNDPPPPAPPYPRHQQALQQQPAVGERAAANNFTAFPSNHKQHSGAAGAPNGGQTSSPLTTEVVTPTSATVAIAGITSFPPAATTPLPELSSFRAANGHLYPGRATGSGSAAIVTDRSVQHQISGYRKRQLYANAAPRRNVTDSSEGHFTKEFVPSPEVIPFFQEESAAPGSPGTGAVDAPYPVGPSETGGDSRWYAGVGLSAHGYVKPSGQGGSTSEETEGNRWEHKYVWTTSAPRQQVKFPQDPTPHFPPPKGRWKWIPEEETESVEDAKSSRSKPTETPFSSTGSFEEHHFGRHPFAYPTTGTNHPYSFDRAPIGSTFSGEPAISVTSNGSSSSSSNNSSSGSSSESNETSNGIGGTTDVKLVGKEDAHLKSVSPWKKIIHVLSAAIPIGLLISALTPQVVYISPNATLPPLQLQTPTPVSGSTLSSTGLRQRSLTGQDGLRFLLAQRGLGTDPVALVKLLRKLNALEQRDENDDGTSRNRLMDTGKLQGCDWKLLCQLARQGMSSLGTDDTASLQPLWKIVSETPADWTGRYGLAEIFRTIREGDCDRLQQRACDEGL